MSQVPVILKYSGGHFDQKYQERVYHTWLTDRGVEFTFMLEDAYASVPYVALMPPKDATAFKLRFGL
jgi:hypothetical protein